jgi:Protein of unknown function (DUF4013)
VSGVGDGFAWPFEDPDWLAKLVVQGLIGIIPIVGWIAIFGWMMLVIDNYRAGRRRLPPAGFHLVRGGPIFLVALAYTIVFAIPGGAIARSGSAGYTAGLVSLGNLIDFALRLFLSFLTPAIITLTYQRGLAGGFDVNSVWDVATDNFDHSLVGGLMIIVANVIAGLGVVLCCVGLIVSIPYAIAVTAGIATWYAQMIGPSHGESSP